jgi:hypothetical protein
LNFLNVLRLLFICKLYYKSIMLFVIVCVVVCLNWSRDCPRSVYLRIQEIKSILNVLYHNQSNGRKCVIDVCRTWPTFEKTDLGHVHQQPVTWEKVFISTYTKYYLSPNQIIKTNNLDKRFFFNTFQSIWIMAFIESSASFI